MAGRESRLRQLKTWEDNTQKDPSFVLSVNWRKIGTLEAVIKNFLDGGSVDVLREFDRIASKAMDSVSENIGREISEHIEHTDFSPISKSAVKEEWAKEMERVGQKVIEVILANADKVWPGEETWAIRDLREAMLRALPESLASDLTKALAQKPFSSNVSVWNTMHQLRPLAQKEDEIDGSAADTNTHP